MDIPEVGVRPPGLPRGPLQFLSWPEVASVGQATLQLTAMFSTFQWTVFPQLWLSLSYLGQDIS